MKISTIVDTLKSIKTDIKGFVEAGKTKEEQSKRVVNIVKQIMNRFPEQKNGSNLYERVDEVIVYNMVTDITNKQFVHEKLDIDEQYVKNEIRNDCPSLFKEGQVADKDKLQTVMKKVNTDLENLKSDFKKL